MSQDALHLRIATLASDLAATPVILRTDIGEVTLVVSDLGIALQTDATFAAVKERRADDTSPESWEPLTTDPQFTERRYSVDRSAARAMLASASELGVTVTPPSIVVVNDTLAVDLGRPGQAVDADAVVDAVLEGISRSLARIEVTANLKQTEPLSYTEELQNAVNEAQTRYGHTLTVFYADQSHTLTLDMIAGWLTPDPQATPPAITLDDTEVGLYFEELFAPASSPFVTATMEVINEIPTVVASDGGRACCSDEVATVVAEALLQRLAEPVALPSRPAVSREEQAYLKSLGIVELVGTFTTRHACCQGRVSNIHRFADLVRGVIIEPGESLSLNRHVGRRTEEKGFVEGGFIDKGVLVDDIGGGVSQFATTIFNALIRAGMTIDDYQTHSLYLSRYPFGLDPTISYPQPDLAFTNPTPYGVLVWPTYTDTSITVELYSTRNVEVTIGESVETMPDFCRRVKTQRTRVFSDGSKAIDTFNARYRPEQGRNCDGSRSVPRQCVDPLAGTALPGADEGGSSEELEPVEHGSEREDGTIIECPPPECNEKPDERDSDLERYPDDPCNGVDLTTLVDDAGSEDPGESDTGESDTGESDTGESDTGESDTGESDTGEDDTGESDTGESDTGEDDTGESDTGESDTGESDTGESDTGESDTGEDDTGEDDAGQDELADDTGPDAPNDAAVGEEQGTDDGAHEEHNEPEAS